MLALCTQVNMYDVCGVTLSVHSHRAGWASWGSSWWYFGTESSSFVIISYQLVEHWTVSQRSRVRFLPYVVRLTFQLARCGCTLRVTPQTQIVNLIIHTLLPSDHVNPLKRCVNQNMSRELASALYLFYSKDSPFTSKIECINKHSRDGFSYFRSGGV